MLHVISPAKTLDFDTPSQTTLFTHPQFLQDSTELIGSLRLLPATEISVLMKISEKLGHLNAQRFASWTTPFTPINAKQALFAFKGDVYTGMSADTFNQADTDFAQQHLRILSGLYGLLRPLDLIQAYRLEMGTGFVNRRGKNLYEFWNDKITVMLNRELESQQERVLVNLASNEYWRAVNSRELQATIITPQFKDYKNGEYKIISFFAKKARGMMSAFIVKNKITQAETLKDFDVAGYGFNAKLSSKKEWVFTRNLQVSD